jgi:catechol 2,3-dioxygenase-like lactoylglutathione lyase family enzyme
MLHYITVGSNDLKRAATFYDAVLATLGMTRSATKDRELGYGLATPDPLWRERFFFVVTPYLDYPATWGNGTLIAFRAPTRKVVDGFHAAALAHGGTDDGPPGLRPYHASFYSCYVRDPDGNKLSAVCEAPAPNPGTT